MNLKSNELMVRYLLGDLSQDEEEGLEREYFTDNKAWEALAIAEDDLIRGYLSGKLSELQNKQFEKRFLDSPKNRERVALAELFVSRGAREGLAAHSKEAGDRAGLWWHATNAPPARWRLAASLAGAIALIAGICAAVLIVQNQRLRADLHRMRSEKAFHQSPGSGGPGEQNPNSDGRSQSGSLSYSRIPMISRLLTPDMARGTDPGNAPQLVPIPAVVSSISLALDLEKDDYSHYEAALLTAEGKEIRRIDSLTDQALPDESRVVILNIPSELLNKGDYVIKLSGKTSSGQLQLIDSYVFSAVK